MKHPDHFHAKYRHNGETFEIEGGFVSYPDGWDTWTEAQQDEYYIGLCVSWGMPPDAELLTIAFAG